MKKLFANITVILVGLALLVVNVIRILKIPITFDETCYGPGTYWELMKNSSGGANNHILHSILRKFFVEAFGNTLFFLRLDSLIAQVFFLIFSFLTCRFLFKNVLWATGSFIILNLISPYMFNFWGLSRGYALALAFMMTSIYYLLRYIQDKKLIFICFSFAGAILSVYSNFGYINYFVALFSVVIIQRIIFREGGKSSFIKEIAVLIIATSVLALMIAMPLSLVYGNGELRFMGNKGFIEDTVKSLAGIGLYHNPAYEPVLVNNLQWFTIILTYLSLMFWIYVYIKKIYKHNNADIEARFGIVFFLLLIVPVVALITQYEIFRINYLNGRTALFFIPLFTLQMIYLLYYFSRVSKIVSVLSFLTLFVFVCYNFLLSIDFYKTVDWYFNAMDETIFKRMMNESKNKNDKIRVCVSWKAAATFNYSIKYFYFKRFYPIVEISNIPQGDTAFDYYYLINEDLVKVPSNYEVDTVCSNQGFVLFKRK